MPSDFMALDNGFPRLEAEKNLSTEEKLQRMTDYLMQLLEQLRYTLHNLSTGNFNRADLEQFAANISTPVNIALQEEIDRATAAEGTLQTNIGIQAGRITAEVTRAEGAEGALGTSISAVQQTADAIKAQVTDGNGNYTVLNLQSDGLHIGNAQGTTTISGDNITAGTIEASQIAANTITLNKLSSEVTGSFGDPNPGYIKSTYIDSARIVSPTIEANEFNVYPNNDSSSNGGFNIYGFWDAALKHVFQIYYWGSDLAPLIQIESPIDAHIDWDAYTTFKGVNILQGETRLYYGVNYGDTLPTTGLSQGRIFFKI